MSSSWFGGKKGRAREVDWARHVQQDTQRTDQALIALIAINVLVWAGWSVAMQSARSGDEGLLALFGDHFLVPGVLPLALMRPWTLLTSTFSHIDFGHIAFNMIALYVFGREVGRQNSTFTLVQLYVVGGVLASAAHVAFGTLMGAGNPALGASGAVMALGAVYALTNPNRILMINFILPMPAWAMFTLYVVLDVVGLGTPGSGIAHAAHLGGALYGLLYWLLRIRPSGRPRFKKGTYGTRL